MSDPVDLTNCDREPIHIPGSIQPHGVMLVCHPATGLITHCSANAPAFLRASQVVGLGLEAVLGKRAAHDLRNTAAKAGGGSVAGLMMGLDLPGLEAAVDASIHHYEGRMFVELQPAETGAGSAREAFDMTHSLVLRLGRETDVEAIARAGARLIRAMLGYDRVMVYRLLHNGAGLVIAEAKKSSLHSFMGQHFPASDIPQQARRLYLLNTIRAICDVGYQAVPVLPPLTGADAPIDMSFAQLRSVSPIHCEYLRNMGVSASMSISIVVEGELWGLIACHHDQPKVVPMPLRVGAELFGHYFSLQIALAERRAESMAALGARERLDLIVAALNPDEPVRDVLKASLQGMAEMLPCDGAGLWLDGQWDSVGAVPSQEEIAEVVNLVARTAKGEVWETHDLRAQLGNAKVYGTAVAGLLAIPISSIPRDYLLLFRSEEAHNLEWAGEPVKAAGGFGDRLTPRGSFEIWRQEVRGRSQPWTAPEHVIAETIRTYLRDVVLRFNEITADERGRAEERRRVLNDELNHRVKNILALVKSISAQTSAHAASVEDYALSLEGRLRALAYAHDQSLDGKAGDLLGLIEAEAGLHRYGAAPDRVRVDGPAVGLDDRAFNVLALVVHEMMTNAAKYGALSTPAGRLSVTWSLAENGDCVIEWLESGGPALTGPITEGFGSKLVRSTLSYDLGGAATVEYRPGGVWARFVLPAARLTLSDRPAQARPARRAPTGFFLGKRVLVVEDQSLIAMDMEETFRRLGAAEVRCYPNTRDAQTALAASAPDYAVLDFNLGDHTSAALADELLALRLPFVFATGYGDSVVIPERFKSVSVLRKPISADMLEDAFLGTGQDGSAPA